MKILQTAIKKIILFYGIFLLLSPIGCMPPAADIETGNVEVVSVTATEGYFSDRVMLSWSEVKEANKYIIYRSDSAEGPFNKVNEIYPDNMKSRVENADMLIEVPVEKESPVPGDSGYINPIYLNVIFSSPKDISGGQFILGSQTPKLSIIMGSGAENEATVNCVASFPGNIGGKKYEINDIADVINSAANMAICEVTADRKHLKFSSSWGPIVFKNEANSLSYSPIDCFIKSGVGKTEVLVINKDGAVVMSESDYNNRLASTNAENKVLGLEAFFGNPPSQDDTPADTGPVMIARVFSENDAFYFDDVNNETGKHYFYRIQALRNNGTQASLSNCAEGFKISATAPKAPQNAVASQGEYSDKTVITWEPVSGSGITYKVYRTLAYPGTFDSSSPLAVNLTEPTFEDTAISAGQYLYRVVAFNAAGEEGRPSNNATGFRKATNRELLHIAYYETVVGEKRVAQALGKERVADSIREANVDINGYLSGKVNYTLNISGVSGTGTWTFTDYCNYSAILNGKTSMDSDASKDGDIRGKVGISGIYTGYMDYYIHVNNGDVASGYFMVSQDSGAEEKIEWSETFKSFPY